MQWECNRASSFETYPPRLSQVIEVAFQSNEKYAEWTDNKTHKPMRVYFDKMIETLVHDRQSSKEVRRQVVEKGEIIIYDTHCILFVVCNYCFILLTLLSLQVELITYVSKSHLGNAFYHYNIHSPY